MIRLYGFRPIKTWKALNEKGREVVTQYEYRYRDLNEKDECVNAGSEDFSPMREKAEIRTAWLWTWDGVSFNKGGHRRFDCIGLVRYRRKEAKEVKEHFKRILNVGYCELR